jgi:uncharacterized protein (DUF736 family)
MMIGTFKAEGEGYTGELNALGLTISEMTFRPVQDKQGDGPDFIAIGYGEFDDLEELAKVSHPVAGQIIPNSNTYEIGAAWKRTSQKGKPYLSVKLDGPTLAAPIHCALVGRKDGTYRLIWSRKGEGEEDPVQEQAAA